MFTRVVQKANALVLAWYRRYGTIPNLSAVVSICSVAEHETACGDAWNESGDWGAIYRRSLTVAEQLTISNGGVPTPTDPFEQLHGDSDPIKGKYAVWFWAFPKGVPTAAGLCGDVAGADKLLQVLLEERPKIKAAITTMSFEDLALAMYQTGYFTGFHDPRLQPGQSTNAIGLTPGQQANVNDYAGAITYASNAFKAGLLGWEPGNPTLPDPMGVQHALNLLTGTKPNLVEDGILGPKSVAIGTVFGKGGGIMVAGAADMTARPFTDLLEADLAALPRA